MTFSLTAFKSKLSRRLVSWIIIISSTITVVTTGVQLYFDYTNEIEQIEKGFYLLEKSHLPSLINNVWALDEESIQLQIDGLALLPDIEYMAISVEGRVKWKSGELISKHRISKSYPLFFEYLGKNNEIGTLFVEASIDGVINRIWNKLLVVLLSNALKTFFVAGFMFLLFYRLVTRHLIKIAKHTYEVDLSKNVEPIYLERKQEKNDELDKLVKAIYLSQKATVTAVDTYRESEKRFRRLFENSEVSIWNEDFSEVINILDQLRKEGITDLQQYLKDNHSTVIDIASKVRVFQVNGATLKLFGATTKDEFLNHIHKTFGPGAIEVFINELCAIWDGKNIFRSETEFITLGGKAFTAIISLNIPDNAEDFKSIPVSIIDITDRKISEEGLRLFAKVFSETTEGIIITDTKGIIIDVNPAFCEITGYSREDAIGQNPSLLNSGKQSPAFYQEMWKIITDQKHWQGEVWNRKKNGEVYAELLSISSIPDAEGNTLHYVGIFTDVTHSKKQQEALEQMAHYDVLTQLPNRALLADRYTQALAHSKRQENQLAVCFLDLDNFKPINDLYGHEIGDELLVEVAKRIKSIIRDEDTASRQGGDEFVLLLGDIDQLSQCEQMLNRVLTSLSQPYLIDTLSLTISASIGFSLYPTDNTDLDTLMRHADQAMYQAKQAGRNRYHLFNAKQNQLDIKRNSQLKEIDEALVNNELCMYYQPKVNMATGEVFGAEALIRWNHPEKGLIPPFKFLPVIEKTGLEIQVGNWVINEVLRQMDHWKKQGIELEVSINISSYHLQHPTFIDELETALAKYPQIHSKKVQLEILESSALSNLQAISSIITTCIDTLGVSVALDDFGTGYSSLTHLRNLPAKTIKIDQTFVRDVLDDPSDLAIIDGVIGLSNSFSREIIAEGIETTNHGLMLLILGCYEAQGYGIARPMPSADVQDWLSDYTPNQEWINCATKIRTEKERKLKLFRLTFSQWQKQFETNINSEPENIGQWPILKRTNCHCGVWIKRARQEQLFEDKWLNKLDDAHNTMHDIADDLFNKYQQGQIQEARLGLNDLEIAIEHLGNILGQCE